MQQACLPHTHTTNRKANLNNQKPDSVHGSCFLSHVLKRTSLQIRELRWHIHARLYENITIVCAQTAQYSIQIAPEYRTMFVCLRVSLNTRDETKI